MNTTSTVLRNEVRELAEEAFHRKLISGYGDGENINEYQIIYQGKPRHIPLAEARLFLIDLIYRNSIY
ncbi:MAG: hypothetical protein EAZ87_18790 [Nostocales cyanobacterium]|nr:MAG: hypothetical protein EAZ87_18790 [Nostocales cyanobacterium]